MTVGGSQQLRIFRRARRDGASIEAAAEAAGMAITEARLHAGDDDKNPPPPEAFELLGTTPAKEADVATGRKARAPEDKPEEIKKKDFAGAVRAYREDILPAQSAVGEHAQEQSTAYKHIKKQCHIQPTAARQAFRLDQMEDAKRDDWIRGFLGLLRELKIPLESNDLVDQAERATGAKKPVLATMGIPSDGSETDLADAAEDNPKDEGGAFEEASEEELSAQAGRGASRAPKIGDGFVAPLH